MGNVGLRTIGVVTVARSDYGIYLPLLRAIQADSALGLKLYVGGMHLAPESGMTVNQIAQDGFEIAERVEMLLASDTPEGIAKSIGIGVMGFAQAFARTRPDLLVVLGDRFEMYAAAAAALPFNLPLAHIHGGEVTEGAIDDALRHSITKLAHLHLVSTEEYARRVRQLGEEPWRVHVVGALGLDNLHTLTLLTKQELERRLDFCLDTPPLLVTFHPTTLEYEQAEAQTHELLAALEETNLPIIFTLPNADTNGRVIVRLMHEFADNHSSARLIDNLGTQPYFSLMKYAAAMVGNSSSGIIEAPSFRLPVVNIGARQRGRVRAANVIDVGNTRAEIFEGIQRATQPKFRASLSNLKNPYGDGHAAEKIVAFLRSVMLDARLPRKKFCDVVFDA